MIVSEKGDSAINFEHSWGDGVAVLRYLSEVFRDSNKLPLVAQQSPSIPPRKLEWSLNDSDNASISKAEKRYLIFSLSLFFLRVSLCATHECK